MISSRISLMAAAALGVALGFTCSDVQQAHAQMNVPWIGQAYCQAECPSRVFWQGRNNCGPTSIGMVAQANGKRPPGLTNSAFVRAVRVMIGNGDNCALVGTDKLDTMAGALGLCKRADGKAIKASEIDALVNQRCLPVVTFVDGPAFKTLVQNHLKITTKYGTALHIVVVTGMNSNTVFANDPLDKTALTPGCGTGHGENTIYGQPQQYPRDKFEKALRLAVPDNWMGRAYGDKIGGCDFPNCNTGAGGGGGSGGHGEDQPFTRVVVRMANFCQDSKKLEIFWVTNNTPAGFHGDHRKDQNLEGDTSRFKNYTFNMEGRSSWKGTLKKLRIDPTEQNGCQIAISAVSVQDKNGNIGKAWIWSNGTLNPSGGWRSINMTLQPSSGGFLNFFTKTTDPIFQHEGVNLNLRR